jgi:hypothetical protein
MSNLNIPYLLHCKKYNCMHLPSLFAAALLFAGTSLPAKAQLPLFEAGIEAGPGAVWMRGNEAINNFRSNLAVIPAGVFLQTNVNRRLALRMHLQYDVKGVGSSSNAVDAAGNVTGKNRYRYMGRYLALPVMLRVYTGFKRRLFVNAGPYAAFLLNWTERNKTPGQPLVKQNVTSSFEWFDAGISAGAGVSWPLDRLTNLMAEARFNHGLVNISSVEIVDGGRLKTNSLQCLLGISRKLVKQRK